MSLQRTTFSQPTHGQGQSLFFKLPPLIREMVYENLFPVAAQVNVFSEAKTEDRVGTGVTQVFFDEDSQPVLIQGFPTLEKVGSLRCQRIYFEAIWFIFNKNTWAFNSTANFSGFLSDLRPGLLRSISTISLDILPCHFEELAYRQTRNVNQQFAQEYEQHKPRFAIFDLNREFPDAYGMILARRFRVRLPNLQVVKNVYLRERREYVSWDPRKISVYKTELHEAEHLKELEDGEDWTSLDYAWAGVESVTETASLLHDEPDPAIDPVWTVVRIFNLPPPPPPRQQAPPVQRAA
ncbi:hypothetical protein BT63DRAFT_480862 [Microthyrium microscopicum]|uniref:DUF7730 domain-containing protein n=1 Tax=Microthyrium microscopicum TaxID=703497 RepID=A0A6A6UAN1_9PEZI|nr:hypothetical protein BT63DRAFT_480862 [Microthyrium microscopicum]